MIQVIFFDLWGVLATRRTRIFDQIITEYGLTKTAHPHFITLLEQMEIGALDEAGFWQQFYEEHHIGMTVPVLPWLEIFRRITVFNKPVLALAEKLRKYGYTVAILSNTDPTSVEFLRKQGIVDTFDAAIFSCDVASMKPNPAIFTYALEKLKTAPNEAAFIDDSEQNVIAANALGMHALLFEDTERLADQLAVLLPTGPKNVLEV